jgi:hypothetical protein
MKATSPADAVEITMKGFPADAVGIQVISCSVLHILLLLRWDSCSELLHNTNPAAKCEQKLFCSLLTLLVLSVPQEQGMCSTAKEVSVTKRAQREAGRTGHCAQPSVYQLATAVDPASAASSCRESFAVSASASSRSSPPEYHNGEPTNRGPRGAATIVKPGVCRKSSRGSQVGPIQP